MENFCLVVFILIISGVKVPDNVCRLSSVHSFTVDMLSVWSDGSFGISALAGQAIFFFKFLNLNHV